MSPHLQGIAFISAQLLRCKRREHPHDDESDAPLVMLRRCRRHPGGQCVRGRLEYELLVPARPPMVSTPW